MSTGANRTTRQDALVPGGYPPEIPSGVLNGEQERLLLEHLPIVRFLARRIHDRLPQHVDIEDLVSAGVVGLMDAFTKFDPEKNATSPATTTYSGDSDVNYLQTPNGQKIQLNVPGNQIFLGATSVFGVLNSLVADYASGTVNTAQATQDTQALTAALNTVSQQRVTIDNSITQLTAASGAITTEQAQLTAAQTNLMQADLATVATQLSLSKTQETALESVISQLGSGSLFDKLQ
ncbi:MAG: sigma factor [Terracidiphilus sp.]